MKKFHRCFSLLGGEKQYVWYCSPASPTTRGSRADKGEEGAKETCSTTHSWRQQEVPAFIQGHRGLYTLVVFITCHMMNELSNLLHKEHIICRTESPFNTELNRNVTHPYLWNFVKVKSSKTEGRYMSAKQKILPGEVLVVEPALSTSLFREYYPTHCLHCFRRLEEEQQACPGCTTVKFFWVFFLL